MIFVLCAAQVSGLVLCVVRYCKRVGRFREIVGFSWRGTYRYRYWSM
jgi:hypothetical protein